MIIKPDEISFHAAFLMLKTSKNAFLLWQPVPEPKKEEGEWEGPILAGVFDVEKNLFQKRPEKDKRKRIVKFFAKQCFAPTTRHRLELWWKYGDEYENSGYVHSATRIAYVASPDKHERNDYQKWEKSGGTVYEIDKNMSVPRTPT